MNFDPNSAAKPDSGLFGLETDATSAWLHILPVPWDATTSFGSGTEAAPDAILKASHQIDTFDLESGLSYLDGIWMAPPNADIKQFNKSATKEKTLGNIKQVNELSQHVMQWVEAECLQLLNAQKKVGVLGGDHSVPLGLMKALANTHKNYGVLQIDAHADFRKAYQGFTYSHASIMFNTLEEIPEITRCVQAGVRDFCKEEYDYIKNSPKRILTHFDKNIQKLETTDPLLEIFWKSCLEELPETIYLSFDIDGLNPTLCPQTGTPVPGGFEWRHIHSLFSILRQSKKKLIGFDLSEVGNHPWDANVGARILYQICLLSKLLN